MGSAQTPEDVSIDFRLDGELQALAPSLNKSRQRTSSHPLLQLRLLGFGLLQDGDVGAPSNNESPNLHPVFLRHRWDDAVQAQILDKLSVMVGDMVSQYTFCYDTVPADPVLW